MKSFKELLLEKKQDDKIVLANNSMFTDKSKVTKQELLSKTKMNNDNVRKALGYFINEIKDTANKYDADKITDIDGYYKYYKGEDNIWHNSHRKINRHHLDMANGVPDDVDLIDIIGYITCGVVGNVTGLDEPHELKLSKDLLMTAFKNTVDKLEDNVKV